jgi:hypothetical protein
MVTVAGCLIGPGYWLCGAVWDGHPFGKSPAEVHFTEFVLASAVVVVASWGLLLILGEALLFTLTIFRAYDEEQYDIYRNLMILWGYVLTLGIPRHFRRLPAQFGALNDDVGGGPHGGDRRTTDRPPTRDQRSRRAAEEARDARRYPNREDPRRYRSREDAREARRYPSEEEAREARRYRSRGEARETREYPNREEARETGRYPNREDPRDHTGCQNHAPERGGPWDHEDVRDHRPCRERTSPGQRVVPRQERTRDTSGSRRRDDERNSGRDDARPRSERDDERRSGRDDAPRRERARDGQGRRTGDRRVAGGPERVRPRRPAEPEESRVEPEASRVKPDVSQAEPDVSPAKPDVSQTGPGVPLGEPGAVPDNPLGPIFPPRPAVEAGTAPIAPVTGPVPPGGVEPSGLTVPGVAASLADAPADAQAIPGASAELRDALGLLLRYAVRRR